mgnify:FL=1
MTYEEIVAYTKNVVAAADLKAYKGHLAAQINITGEGEGAFYIELNDGTAAVEPYEYFDRDVILQSTVGVFADILDGKKYPQEALDNNELAVIGDAEKALELVEILKKKTVAKKAAAKKAEAKPAAKKAPAKKAEAKPAAKKAEPVKKAEAKPAAKKAEPVKKAEAKPAAKKAEPVKKEEAKPAAKKAEPVKKAEVKPVTAETKKAAVATAKKNVAKKATK